MKAFSLIELLIVIALFAILLGLAVPAMNSMRSAGAVTRAGGIVADQITLARQEAAAKSRDVEVRFLKLTRDGATNFTGIQLWIAQGNGTMTPLGRLLTMPSPAGIVDSPALSPLMGFTNGTMSYSGSTMDYKGFRIRSNGAPERTLTVSNNFLTVQALRPGSTDLADNFFAVRINPLTGGVTTHRP